MSPEQLENRREQDRQQPNDGTAVDGAGVDGAGPPNEVTSVDCVAPHDTFPPPGIHN